MESNREKILMAAINQFNAFGIQGATIAGIAHQAGLSKGALYYYYPSRESLVEDSFRYVRQNAMETTHRQLDLSLPPEQLVKQLVVASYVWPTRHPEQMRFMDSYISLYFYEKDAYRLFLFEIFKESEITRAMREKLKDTVPLELINFLVGNILTVFGKYVITNPEYATPDFIEATAQIIWDAVSR